MTDLTEQWKKRTLRNGAYYIKMLGGEVLPAFCNTEYILKQFQTMKGIYSNVAEVLAEVPDYVEWRNMVNCACEEHEANKRFIEENAQLKTEYEKECKRADELEDSYWKVEKENKKLKKQLAIAIEALKIYANKTNWDNHFRIETNCEFEIIAFIEGTDKDGEFYAEQALKQIKDLEK